MTFSYVGYVWALLGCCSLSLFVGVVAVVLHLVGRRIDRSAPRAHVESIPLPPGGEGDGR